MDANQKKLRWLVACDESGTDGAPYYGFGSLWMKWQRRGDFARDIRQLRERYSFTDEIKWQKAHSKRFANFYEDLIDYFFKSPWLAFHCIVVRKGMVEKSFHNGDYDLARRKHFTELVSKKICNVIKAHPSRLCEFRIDVDPIASRYQKADEAFHVIANHQIRIETGVKTAISTVLTKDSKQSVQIQISDFFLGAIISAWRGNASSEGKIRIQNLIAQYLGWHDLASDTKPWERKFNIWYFHDKTLGPREVDTRDVELQYPLPYKKKP